MVDYDAVPESAAVLFVAGLGTVIGHLLANTAHVALGLAEIVPWDVGLAVGVVLGLTAANVLVRKELPSLGAAIVGGLIGIALHGQFQGIIESVGVDPFTDIFATFLFGGLAAVIAPGATDALKGLFNR